MNMNILFSALPDTLRGPDDDVYHGKVPTRMRMAHPDAARSIMRIEKETDGLIYTDLVRSADAQLLAIRSKRGAQDVGYSGHGYGFSMDLDIARTCRRIGLRYVELIELLGKYGWYCHRRDLDAVRIENWHFNFFSTVCPEHYLTAANPRDQHTWTRPLEKRLTEAYGTHFALSTKEIQEALSDLRFYGGEWDGVMGSLTTEAILAFQRTWRLVTDGIAGVRTQRALAFVTARRTIDSSLLGYS